MMLVQQMRRVFGCDVLRSQKGVSLHRLIRHSSSTGSSPVSAPSAVDLAFLHFPATGTGSATNADNDTPVVFVHGLMGSAVNYRTLCRKPALSGPRDVFSIDLRNHGASPHDPDVSLHAMAADIAAFAQARGLSRVHIVGHSLGGRAAMATAILFPELVHRLIVVDIAPADYAAAGNEVSKSSFAVLKAMSRMDLVTLSSGADGKTGGNRKALDEALAREGIQDPFVRGFALQNCLFDGQQWRWRVGLDELIAGYVRVSCVCPSVRACVRACVRLYCK